MSDYLSFDKYHFLYSMCSFQGTMYGHFLITLTDLISHRINQTLFDSSNHWLTQYNLYNEMLSHFLSFNLAATYSPIPSPI